MNRARLTTLIMLLPALSLAQFQWPEDGVAIRQGAHLGFGGAAVAAGNDVALFYYDCLRDGTRDVMGNRISASGEKLWGTEGRVVSSAVSEQRAPVTAAYPDGTTLVVWEDYSPGRFRDIMAQRYDANGNSMWSPAEGIAVVQTYRDQFDLRLAIDENGYAFVAFTDDRLTDGPETILGAYAQILTPNGNRVGAIDGIQLIDRVQSYNVPMEIVCAGDAAYVLCTIQDPGTQLVIQKISEDGAIGFPDDEAIVSLSDFGQNHLAKIEGGLAIAWSHRAGDFDTDAKLALFDLNLAALPGWSAEGITIASGQNTQTVVGIEECPDSAVMVMIADYETDPNNSMLLLKKYSRNGELIWGPITIGAAYLRSSPLDWFWENDELVLVYAEQNDLGEYRIRSQKVSASGELLWSADGNELWLRAGKKLLVNVEKPASGPARVMILSGRSIAQPESLFVGALGEDGTLQGEAQFITGGWTYDTYDAQAVRIGEQKLGVVWTDSRSRLERDIYFQYLDAGGNSLLEPAGRKLLSTQLYVYLPPAIAADGSGGAFLAWAGDSVDNNVIYHVHRLDAIGDAVWSSAATVRSPHGFYGQPYLVPDSQGGVFLVYNRFEESFFARVGVMHVTASGEADWPNGYCELPSAEDRDVILAGAVSDGSGGVMIAATTGPWFDTQVTVFHLDIQGEFGSGWGEVGVSFGAAGERDRNPRLLTLANGTLLTYERPRPVGGTYDIKGIVIGVNGELPWGTVARRLTPEDGQAVKHRVTDDGQGGFLLAWEDFRNASYSRIFSARYDQDGMEQWEGIERLACTNPMEQSNLTLAHDGRGGAWVMWEDYRNSDIYPEIDVYAQHLDGETGFPATVNGFTWPEAGYSVCDVPTYQQQPQLLSWANGSALAIWKDLRSSNPGRCCGAGAVGDIFQNIYAQVLSEVSLTAEKPRAPKPASFVLSVFPNPFNSTTRIEFDVLSHAQIRLSVFNLLGQQVEVLREGLIEAGTHAEYWNAEDFASGEYFVKLEVRDGETEVRKVVLVK